ncbi:MAG: LysR family transcriptional regulator [Flavobacteriaceae bacterium]|nr:LysR family transcriptional regulator [Flavobacteriaceae bacterium]
MNYTIHQLRVFLKVVEKQSITKASEALYLSQPAVSIQLKKFQEQFDIPLTEVVGRQLYTTPFGEEVAAMAQKIVDEVDALEYKVKAREGKVAGRLKISSVSTGKYVMPYFLSGFVNQYPDVDLTLDVTNRQKVVESLEQNAIDFALVSVMPQHLALNNVPLLANELYLVGGRERDERRSHEASEIFEKDSLLYREAGSATRAAMEQFIERQHIRNKKKMELTSNEALKQAVIAGLGYSIMPLIGIKTALNLKELVIIPHEGLPLVTEWNLVWLKSKKLSPVATAYLEYLETEKQSIVERYFSWVGK